MISKKIPTFATDLRIYIDTLYMRPTVQHHKIIVAYDFHDLAKAALKQAFTIARFLNSDIMLVTALNKDIVQADERIPEALKHKPMKELRELVTDLLQKDAEEASKEIGIRILAMLKVGKLEDVLTEVAIEFNTRFIIMGRVSKPSAIGRLGSGALKVIQAAPCSVISIADSNHNAKFKNIVLPIDLAQQTRIELFNAVSFGLFFDATIHFVSVMIGGIDENKSRIHKKIQQMRQLLETNGVRCTEKLFKKENLPIEKIINQYAQEINADSIMLMTHKEVVTSDKYIGAVANHIINTATLPVISLTSAASTPIKHSKASYWFERIFAPRHD